NQAKSFLTSYSPIPTQSSQVASVSHHKPPGSHDPLPIQSARRSFRVHSSQSAPNRTSYHQQNEQHVNQSYDHTNVNHLSHQHCEYPVIRRSIARWTDQDLHV